MASTSQPPSDSSGSVQTLFVMTFTTTPRSGEALASLVQIADDMLRKKDGTFNALMTEQMQPQAKIEVCNLQYGGPTLHTPTTMQTTMQGWLQRQYQVSFQPVIGKTFFPQGVRDSQGQPNYLLFYFHMA